MKKRFGRYLRNKLGITAVHTELGEEIRVLKTYMNLMLPESKQLGEEVLGYSRSEIQRRYGITDFTPTVHKNDLMFYHHLRKMPESTAEVIFHYFNVGLDSLQKIKEITGSAKVGSVLDFGAGYGRGSRFIPSFFPKADVTVSDVKEHAVRFQEKEFGYHGIAHSESAGSFPSGKKYDLIMAISVFSHLPKELAADWLRKLYECLGEGSSFVFTFNNITRRSDAAGEYHYITQSEDQVMNWVGDRINRSEIYGSTFYSDKAMEDLVRSATGVAPKIIHKFSGAQDAAVLRK